MGHTDNIYSFIRLSVNTKANKQKKKLNLKADDVLFLQICCLNFF